MLLIAILQREARYDRPVAWGDLFIHFLDSKQGMNSSIQDSVRSSPVSVIDYLLTSCSLI